MLSNVRVSLGVRLGILLGPRMADSEDVAPAARPASPNGRDFAEQRMVTQEVRGDE